MATWPFADPENVVTLTVRQIMEEAHPILWVTHDDEDGMWQFLTGDAMRMTDALLVSLRSVYQHDPSIGELADLPCGWNARREAVGMPWQRGLAEREADDGR